jgi:hypothetical protein
MTGLIMTLGHCYRGRLENVHNNGMMRPSDRRATYDKHNVDLIVFSPHRYGVASTYYGISLNITGFGLNVYLTHFIYSAIEVPAKMVVYFCLDTIGRKHCQAGTLLLTGTCIAINIFVPKGDYINKPLLLLYK